MFFLKYRPQTIKELDLTNVRQELLKILAEDSVPHAFLFAGPKGTGKTSAARILAKVVNCQDTRKKNKTRKNTENIEPCNQCDICHEIINGASLDVIEIDAASNRGIDDIRQLKEKISLAPIKSKHKVYIIDEVHMLTNQAFNALLKTLEEPPAHVIFVLCTTDPDKIIPTVMSRLMRIDFNRGTPSEIKRSLDKVIAGEKLTVDKKVIESIIHLSEGGFRDAQKILENLVLSLGKEIKWKEAKKILGYWEKRKPEKILDLIAEAKTNQILKISQSLAEEGASFSGYLKKLLSLIQNLILIKSGVKENGDHQVLAEKFKIEELVELSDIFSQAAFYQKNTLLPQLPFQIAIIKYLQNKESDENTNKNETKINNPQKVKKQNSKMSLEEIKKSWNDLLEVVKPMNHSVAAFLKAAQPKEVNQDCLILEVFYQFHKDKLEEHRNRQIVEQGIEKIFNSCVKIRYKLTNQKKDIYSQAKDIFGS